MIATDDYEILSRAAGLVERPDRAVLELEGAEAAEFLQGQVTNDVEALDPGAGCYALLLDHKGKIRTDMRVLALAPDRLLVDAEGAGLPVLDRTFEMYSLGRQVSHRDVSAERTLLSLIGPAARERLEAAVRAAGAGDPGEPGAEAGGGDPALVPPPTEHAHVATPLGLAVATDAGVDLICTAEQAAAARAALDVPEVSEDAAECLRVESGRPRLGLDMDGSTIPQEAALNERAVDFEKGCYVGQETVARLYYRGKPNRHLRGLRLATPAAHGDAIALGERHVGTIGSSCVSPVHGPIALALVRREAGPGDEVLVGEGAEPAVVVELPFGR